MIAGCRSTRESRGRIVDFLEIRQTFEKFQIILGGRELVKSQGAKVSQAGQRFQAGADDVCPGKVETLKVRQTGEMRQTRVGDFRVGERQVFQMLQFFQPRQAVVGDGALVKNKLFSLGKSFKKPRPFP